MRISPLATRRNLPQLLGWCGALLLLALKDAADLCHCRLRVRAHRLAHLLQRHTAHWRQQVHLDVDGEGGGGEGGEQEGDGGERVARALAARAEASRVWRRRGWR